MTDLSTAETLATKEDSPHLVLWAFFIHTILGTVIFLLVAVPAVLLSLAIHWLQQTDVSDILLVGLRFVEYSVFTIDSALYLSFLVKTAVRTFRRL